MVHKPPMGWADVAAKSDLDHLALVTKQHVDHFATVTRLA